MTIFETTLFLGQDWWPDLPPLQSIDPFHLECDVSADPEKIGASEVANAFIFGRLPNYAPHNGATMQFSLFFPRGMATDAVFPESSSSYTDPDTGIMYESPCFIPKAVVAQIENDECPYPFVAPSSHYMGEGSCIKPCPVPTYSDREYHIMWVVSSVPACLGLVLNIFMALTWCIAGKKDFNDLPFNLKMCVTCGLLYGFIHTIPVLVLWTELPW